MPLYRYHCTSCDHAFEEWQSFHDEELTKCPKCRKKKLRRLLGAGSAIIFKGGGFYETDYRSDSYKSAEKADKEPEKTEAKTETKTETPAPAAESQPAKPAKSKAKK